MQKDDVIYRQAAIETALAYLVEYCGAAFDEDMQRMLKERLNSLPSAQPEIIRCKDCKWKSKHNCTRAVEVWIDDDKFCAWAERRTDAD